MNEYEIADLSASIFAMLQQQLASLSDGIELFMTFLFAYLAAAYFVGKDLSSRQAWIFTGLYVLWQLWTIVVVAIRGAAVFGIAARWSEVSGKELPMLFRVSDVVIPCAVVLLLGALAASLYFMWTTRLGEEA